MGTTIFSSIFLLLNLKVFFGDSLILSVFLSMSAFPHKDFWFYSSNYSSTGLHVLQASETIMAVNWLWLTRMGTVKRSIYSMPHP